MDYRSISKETFNLLYQSRLSLNSSPLSAQVRALVELRVSQLNQCKYCCEVHTKEARKEGIAQEKLDALSNWKNSSLFSEKEKFSLEFAEALTHLTDVQECKERVSTLYSERELVDLTMCISIMNAFNRIAISLKD